MRILMMTNTYAPIVGGLERSVRMFSEEYRRLGHRVLIVAPSHRRSPKDEEGVLRIPAIQNFNGSDFSVHLPVPGILTRALGRFRPDIVHAHHPYLIGDTALRISYTFGAPLVFTHHTLYEHYTHYVPGRSRRMRRFVIQLSTGYANLCDEVFAPSRSVADLLARRGVRTRVRVLPTGIRNHEFASADGARFRQAVGIPPDAFVVGTAGRLAVEKNLGFLSQAVFSFLQSRPDAWWVVLGGGLYGETLLREAAARGVADRVALPGVLDGRSLADGYRAMDVFAFASKSETQGLVLAEAMSCGVPVVGLDAPGTRDIVRDGRNGRLVREESVQVFEAALRRIASAGPERLRRLGAGARSTARSLEMTAQARRALAVYGALLRRRHVGQPAGGSIWERATRRLQAEWRLAANLASATRAASAARRLVLRPLRVIRRAGKLVTRS